VRKAAGFVALVVASQGGAQAGPFRCAVPPRWEDFSALVLTVQGSGVDWPGGLSMKIDHRNYDDGVRLAATLGRGWTIFRASALPGAGIPSTFATRGEFQDTRETR
jgi:hypothetical protein